MLGTLGACTFAARPLRAFYCSSQMRAVSKAMMPTRSGHAAEAPRERSQIASAADWVMSCHVHGKLSHSNLCRCPCLYEDRFGHAGDVPLVQPST